MPIDYSKYPADWKVIRASVLKRAKGICEFCGVANYAHRVKDGDTGDEWVDAHTYASYGESRADMVRHFDSTESPIRVTVIVLTIAHLDHDVANSDPDNLRALCQRCHLAYDAKHHARNARETRRVKSGQMRIEIEKQ